MKRLLLYLTTASLFVFPTLLVLGQVPTQEIPPPPPPEVSEEFGQVEPTPDLTLTAMFLPPTLIPTLTVPESGGLPEGIIGGYINGTPYTLVPLPPAMNTQPTLSPEQMTQQALDEPVFEVIEPTPAEPTVVPLSLEASEALPVVLNARGDLQLLLVEVVGSVENAPEGWSGSVNVSDPQMPLLVRLDIETLAGLVFGPDVRPADWFGVVPSTPLAVARDLRHDLELLADEAIGAAGLRPAGWIGDDPLMRCSRSTQALVGLMARTGYILNLDPAQPNFCQAAEVVVSRHVESVYIQPNISVNDDPSAQMAGVQGNYAFQVDSEFVVAFGDRNARTRRGILPNGTRFDAVARSYVDFSNMMLIRGEGFQVFVDYTTTTLSTLDFMQLTDVNAFGDGSIFCDADWCD